MIERGLNNIKEKYEDHHNVSYTDDAIESCVKLTSRYITDRFLPDKAIDAMDEVGSRVHITNINVPKNIIDIAVGSGISPTRLRTKAPCKRLSGT